MTRALPTILLAGVAAILAVGGAGSAEQPAPAKPAPKAGDGTAKTYVLLVGIAKYDDAGIKERPKAEADAQALYDLFTAKDVNLPKEQVKLLLGKPNNKPGFSSEAATRENFTKGLKWLTDSADEDDRVVIGFIGQGGPLGEAGDRRCYFLSDSTVKDRNKTAVAADDIEDALKKLKAKNLAVLLDIDFKGFKEEEGKAVAEPNLGKAPYREFLGDDGTEDHLAKSGRIAFLATNGLTQSLDLEKHGLFTTVVLDALGGKADNDGDEQDGLVTVDELARYMNKHLPELARKNGKTEKEKEQDHFIIAGPMTHFDLTVNPAAIAAARKAQAKFAEMVKGEMVKDAAIAAEGKLLLERTPVLKARRELRKAYQALVNGGDMKTFEESREKIVASMQLKRTEAMWFAKKVIEVAEIIQADYVREVPPSKLVAWAVAELFSYVEEKVPAKIAERLKETGTMTPVQLHALLIDARLALGKREDLDKQKDLTVTLQRMLHKLDPHTTYIDPEMLKKFQQEVSGSFTGIGIQIRKDAATGRLLVATPIKGSPAYKAGVQAGDLVMRVIRDVDSDGNAISPPEVIETDKLSLNDAVKKILGQPNTKVKVVLKREGEKEEKTVEITRGRVETESILGFKRKNNDDWDFMIDPVSKIGYIRMSSFARTTYRDMEAAVAELRKQGMKGLVFDLRFNPGGLLDIAVKATDLFIDDGRIVSIRPRPGLGREAAFNGKNAGSLLDFPIACLINGYSASGSEIVSAALQDHNRAKIFGERSYGKGSVQNIRDFDVEDPQTREVLKAEIKLTTASFWRPNGQNLNKASTAGKEEDTWGVTPDVVIKLTNKERRDLAEYQRNVETIEPAARRDKLKPIKDRQLESALEYLRGQIKMTAKAGGENGR